MKKFSALSDITTTYLNGTLERLKIEYEDDNTMRAEVMYTDKDEYHLYYIVDIHQETMDVQFVEHYCNYGRDFINIKRNKLFEDSLKNYLFSIQ